VPVRLKDLPALESALGYATLNRRGWYGQLAEWMPLHGQSAGGPQRALFIDGRPQRFDRGEYRLMGRAWVLPMEDGPRLNLQLVPEYHPPQRESLRHLLAQPTHDGTRRGQPITSITLDLLIKPGYALILTGEEPSVEWKADAASADSPGLGRENPSARSSRDHDDPPGGSSNQHQTHLGPYVELPPTLGEMLFKLGGVRGGRGMVLGVRTARGDGVTYALFAPLHYEPNYAYPLIVWLHGAGGSEHELAERMPHVSPRNYLGLALRGPLPSSSGPDAGGVRWSFAAVTYTKHRDHEPPEPGGGGGRG
jgi:hypothetical protein